MRKSDFGMAGFLTLLAAFIWLRDLRWFDAAEDTLPILAGLPLFGWLARPWIFSGGPWRLAPGGVVMGACLFPMGAVLDSTLLLTASWIAFLWSWISVRFDHNGNDLTKLLVLPLVSFPWIANDFGGIGWWFRLSGAAAAQQLLAGWPCEVVRHGTFLFVDGLGLSVEPACSGLNGLEAMIIAGTVVAYLKLKRTGWFWWSFPALAAAAWLANVMRITFTALCVTVCPGDRVPGWLGPLHLAAGWLALCVMFAICWLMFSVAERLDGGTGLAFTRRMVQRPWLEVVLVGYSAWRCQDLAGAWADSPFDQWGWLAFLIWVCPVVASGTFAKPTLSALRGAEPGGARVGSQAADEAAPGQAERGSLPVMGLGLALVFLGDLGDLNLSRHGGLALILMSCWSRRCSALWGASAAAWFPATGWIGSRLGLDPGVLACLRILVAVAGSAWGLRTVGRREYTEPIRRALGNHIAS
ncbi:MAG: archaeosortase/exosortase family protein [Limisphaerales bacterium]